jgi:cytochrome c oxidase assembly protein subunit 11
VIGQKLMSTPRNARKARNSMFIAGACGAFAAGMVGAAYAAVPLYSWFCRTTGFAGTPQVATSPPDHVVARKLKIRFDANVAGGLPWRFEPEENSVSVKVGEVVSVNYRVINQSARDTVGIASFNVSPPTAGAYFSKINCFCFNEQRLKAGEQRDMAVVFFVDPEIVKDAEHDGLDAITLSYTMYPVRQSQPPQSGSLPASGRSASLTSTR